MIDIVYPLKKSAWNKEILFSLRSLERYFTDPCQVHICGDYKPSWLNEKNINYHYFKRNSNNSTEQNTAPVLQWACNKFTSFIWMCDDIYFLKDTSVKDLLPHPTIGNLSQRKDRGNGRWAKLLFSTVDMLSAVGVSPVWNYSTHTPLLYNSKAMLSYGERFPIFTGNVLHETIYYNLFDSKKPLQLKDKAGFYTKGLPIDLENSKYRFLNHDDRGLSLELKQAIETKFNIKSKYER